MTNLRVKLRLGSKSPSSESSPTSLPSSVISIERLRIKNNCLLQCMCIISKQILLYGSDVQLYNEKAFQNIKSIYMYPAHIYKTQYKDKITSKFQEKIWCARPCVNSVPVWFHSRK